MYHIGVSLIVLLYATSHATRVAYKIVYRLSGLKVGALKARNKERHREPDEPVQPPKAGVGSVLLVMAPVVTNRRVTVANMYLVVARFADLFCFGASARKDDIVLRQVKLAKCMNTKHGKKLMQLAQGARQSL